MRRRFKSNTEFSLMKTTADIERNRRFQKPSETRKAKRVRFDDAETDASSRGDEATQSPRCGVPKTSEYAYFRKMKDGAVNGNFRALHKENEQLKSSKTSYLLRETNKASEKLDSITKDLNFSISPPVSKYDEPYEIRRKVSTDAELTPKTKKRSSLLTETVTPVGQSLFSSLQNQATEKSDNQRIEKGIFSEKRKRLCQWVAHTTSSEVEKLHEKGSDLVSFLLCRLIPKGNEKNDSSKGDVDDSSKSLTIYESDNLEKGLPLSHKSDGHMHLSKICSERSSEIVLGEWESFDSGFPSNYRKVADLQNKAMDHSGISSEIVLSERENLDSRAPYNYHKESDLQNETMEPDQHSNSRICSSSGTQHGFSFCLPFESLRSLGAFHFKDLDEFDPIIGHGREEPYRHSLEWDFELGKDRVDRGTRKDVCHRRSNSWNVDHQRIVDSMLDTKGFSPSPLFSRGSLFNPLPNYPSTGCLIHEVEPNLDDVKYTTVEPQHFSLTFPSSPKCIPLADDRNGETDLSNSNITFSYRDPRWYKKVWDCTAQSEFWWKCLSAPEDHPSGFHAWQFPQNENGSCSLSLLKEAHGEPFTSYCEGAFDHYLLSSTLHSPLDAFMNCPLLLNHVSQDMLDQELYSDDYDNELRYRKLL